MGNFIDLKFLATSANFAVQANISTPESSLVREANDLAIALQETANTLLPNTFTMYSEDSQDYRNTNTVWIVGSKYKECTTIWTDGGAEYHGNNDTPEWYKPYPVEEEKATITCYKDNYKFEIQVSGFSNLLVVAETLSTCLYNNNITPDYIQYSDTHVLTTDGEIKAISSFSEEIQEKVFGIEPKWLSVTDMLFSSKLHPELVAIYGNTEAAKRGYKLGEFALWITSKKTYFYAEWRKNNTPSFLAFKRLGMEAIEGEYSSNNVVYDTALSNFRKDAVTYHEFGNERQLFADNWKIAMIDGKLTKVYFSIEDYFPL